MDSFEPTGVGMNTSGSTAVAPPLDLAASIFDSFLLVSRRPEKKCHAIHNLENFEANDQICALDGLAIVIDRLFQAGSHIIKVSISSEKCLYDFPYYLADM